MTMGRFCTACGGAVQDGACTRCKRKVATDPAGWSGLTPPASRPPQPDSPVAWPGWSGAATASPTPAGYPTGFPAPAGYPTGAPAVGPGRVLDPVSLAPPENASGSSAPRAPGAPVLAAPGQDHAPNQDHGSDPRPGLPPAGWAGPNLASSPVPAVGRPAVPPGSPIAPPQPQRVRRSRRNPIVALIVLLLILGLAGGFVWYRSAQDSTSSSPSGSRSSTSAQSGGTGAAAVRKQIVGAIRLDLPVAFKAVPGAKPASAKAFGNGPTAPRSAELVTVTTTVPAHPQPAGKYAAAARSKQGGTWQAELTSRASARGRDCQGPKVTGRADFSRPGYFGTDLTLNCRDKNGTPYTERHRFLMIADGKIYEVTVFAASTLWVKDKALLGPIASSAVPTS